MKKATRQSRLDSDRDTMRPEYDFSKAVRGVTAKRYTQGSNIVVIDPDVLDVFPDAASVNEALRAFAPVLRQQRSPKRTAKAASRARPASPAIRRP